MKRAPLTTKRRNNFYVRYHDGYWKIYRWSIVATGRGGRVKRYMLIAAYPGDKRENALRTAHKMAHRFNEEGYLF